MKTKFIFLIVLATGIVILSSFSFGNRKATNYRDHLSKIIVNNQTDYYLGDTEYGDTSAYAVYGTGTGFGASINEVVKYSTGISYTATGHTYNGGGNYIYGKLTASNHYSWNGPLVQ